LEKHADFTKRSSCLASARLLETSRRIAFSIFNKVHFANMLKLQSLGRIVASRSNVAVRAMSSDAAGGVFNLHLTDEQKQMQVCVTHHSRAHIVLSHGLVVVLSSIENIG
jgi:hypothetical protein